MSTMQARIAPLSGAEADSLSAWILPTFPRAASPKTQPIELPWAEPGVKHGQ